MNPLFFSYFVTKNDQIRKISDPEAVFQYRINRNERFNVKHREAMNGKIQWHLYMISANLGQRLYSRVDKSTTS